MKIKKQKDVTRQQKPTPLIESSKVKKNVSFNWRQIKIEKQKEVTPQQELTPLIESSEVQYTLTNWKQIMMEKREVRQQVHTPLIDESKTKKTIEQYPDCLHEAWVIGWGFVEDHLTHEVDCVGDRVVGVEPVEECWLGFWWV